MRRSAIPTLDPELLELALTHRSFAYENGSLPTNERLEFLGDSVLGVVVTETLYRTHPAISEGRLAKLRAAVVNARALADVARTIGLGEHVLLARARRRRVDARRPRSSPTPSRPLIGAVYLSGGFEDAAAVVHLLFDPLLEAAAAMGAGLDWKTSLQELSAAQGSACRSTSSRTRAPTTRRPSPPGSGSAARLHGQGVGRSKKEAEQQAAESAYRTLVRAEPTPPSRSEAAAEAAAGADAGGAPPRPGCPHAGDA